MNTTQTASIFDKVSNLKARRRTLVAAQAWGDLKAVDADLAALGCCPGCGDTFSGTRGLRSHQSGRYVTLACRPRG